MLPLTGPVSQLLKPCADMFQNSVTEYTKLGERTSSANPFPEVNPGETCLKTTLVVIFHKAQNLWFHVRMLLTATKSPRYE